MSAHHAFAPNDRVTVSAEWLQACGMGGLAGLPFIVTRVRCYGQGRTMLDVVTPNCDSWVVWTVRGVSPYIDPADAAAADAAIAAIEAGLVASGAIDAPAMVPQQCQQQQARHCATPDVSSRYGAPMGRASATFANLDPAERLYLTRIRINSGGYDAGGAYWGLGAPLWCVMDHTNECAYFRARDRVAAKAHVIDNHDSPDQVRFYR